jgi:hypothetical protein
MASEAVRRYEELLRRTALDSALCWTVVEPVTAPVNVDEVVRRLGGDPGTVELAEPDDVPAGWTVFHLHPVGSAVALLEVNNSQGSRPEVLRRLSDGARVHSAFWNVNAVSRFSYAVYGTVLATFEALDLPDPGPLDGDLDDLYAAVRHHDGHWSAAMLAVIERRTGVALDDDWLGRPHPVAAIPAVPADPRPPGFLGGFDPDLDVLLRLAPEPVQRAALRLLVSGLAAIFDLTDEPAVGAVVDVLKVGFPTDDLYFQALAPLGARLHDEYQASAGTVPMRENPRWQRMQAGAAISLAVAPPGHWEDRLDAFYHASLALTGRWPELRAQVRMTVREG